VVETDAAEDAIADESIDAAGSGSDAPGAAGGELPGEPEAGGEGGAAS
jgi:hypothetical protein